MFRIQWSVVGVHCENGNVHRVVTRSPAYARSKTKSCSRLVSVLYISSSVPSVIRCVLWLKWLSMNSSRRQRFALKMPLIMDALCL